MHARARFRASAAVLSTTLAAALALAGCGDDGHPPAPHSDGDHPGAAQHQPPPGADGTGADQAGAEHNQADIDFVRGMIPHHTGALDMAALAPGRAASPEVTALAARIAAAQGPEITTMTGWLRQWGVEPPVGEHGAGHGTGHGGPGADEPAGGETDRLAAAQGAEFDRMFLEMMIRHHEGAVSMSQAEIASGANPAATRLAREIADAQQAEIREMRDLLTRS